MLVCAGICTVLCSPSFCVYFTLGLYHYFVQTFSGFDPIEQLPKCLCPPMVKNKKIEQQDNALIVRTCAKL